MKPLKSMLLKSLPRDLIKYCLVAFSIVTVDVTADVLPMPVSENVSESANTPRQGIDMDRVEAQYGEPLEKVESVGEPPITRWVYPAFTVFFEHDKVLHSVIHRS